ncbi:MAG: inositol monophosphatase family protein, partial [Clostridia bacterium]
DAIHVAFPEDQIYGEEMGGDCACAQRRWIIDPIDGTENFSRGIAEYAISIGFESTPGELVMGVVYAPAMGEMFWAAQGMGAYLNDQPIHVSTQNDPQFAVTAVAPPFRRHELTHRYFATVEMLFLNTCDTRNTGSAALHGCYVACGRVEAYIEADVMPYDIAAALAIISEAGGNWGSLYSQGHPFETHEILCSNSLLYPWYRQCCQRSDAP